jgi:pimeloyl-ACP methyl ester carboxylesterase
MTSAVRLAAARTDVPSGSAQLCVYTTPATGRLPIVFMHAAIGDSRMWHHEIATLGPSRRVVAFDRRGFGETRATHERHAPVDDAIAVLDAFGIARAILVGCSNGGRIALDTAVEHPDRVAGLVLVCAAVGGAPEKPIWTEEPLKAIYDAWLVAEQAKDNDALARISAHVWLDGPLEPDGRVQGSVRDLYMTMMERTLVDPEDESVTDMPDTAYAALPTLDVPTLVYWGPLDVSTVTDVMQHAAATIPGATGVEIPGTGHLPNLERPDLFVPPLEAFIARLD